MKKCRIFIQGYARDPAGKASASKGLQKGGDIVLGTITGAVSFLSRGYETSWIAPSYFYFSSLLRYNWHITI